MGCLCVVKMVVVVVGWWWGEVFGVILQAPLHSPGTEHFPSPSLISSWRKYLPQVNTTLRPLGHPLSVPLSVSLSLSLCPGACLSVNPRINQSTNPNIHLRVSPLHTPPPLPPPPPPSAAGSSWPTSSDVVLHAPVRTPLSPLSSIPSSFCLKFNLIYISPGVTKYPHYQSWCLPALFCVAIGVIYLGRKLDRNVICHTKRMVFVTGVSFISNMTNSSSDPAKEHL